LGIGTADGYDDDEQEKRSHAEGGTMIDSLTKRPIQVYDDGDGAPYIVVQLDQLDQLKKLLDGAGIPYRVEDEAFSFNDQPFTAVVNVGRGVDVPAVQNLLDKTEDGKTVRHRRSRSGRRG
jgi:hypothetical protein